MVILRSSRRIFQSKEKLVVMKVVVEVGVEVGVEEEEEEAPSRWDLAGKGRSWISKVEDPYQRPHPNYAVKQSVKLILRGASIRYSD